MSNSSDLVQAAYSALREGLFSLAIEKAGAALEHEPANEHTRMILAQALDKSGQPAKAAEVIAEIAETESNRPGLLHLQANLLRRGDRRDDALPFAQRFAKLRPMNSDAHALLGVLLFEAGRPAEAATSLELAVRLGPRSESTEYNLALSLIQLGRVAEAMDVLRGLASYSPRFVLAHVCLGEMLLKQGQYQAAIECARKALSIDPEFPNAHILLASAIMDGSIGGAAGSSEEEAERHLRTALSVDPNSSTAHRILGFALQQNGHFDAAAIEFEHSIRIDPRQGNVYYGLSTCRKHAEIDDPLFNRLDMVLTNDDLSPVDRAYVHYALGKILEDRRNFQSALSHFDAGNAIMLEMNSPKQPFDREALENYASEVIDTFDCSFFEKMRELGSKSELPLIVLGMMRSGTTLVEQILSSHPSITGAGELTFWPENASTVLSGKTNAFERKNLAQLEQNYIALLREIGPSANRVVDKMPQNTLNLGSIHALFPEARIIHCRRHPVDTCLSIYTTPYGISPDFAHSRKNIVTAYRQYLRLMAHWRKVIPPDRFLEIGYEELVAERETTTRNLIEFAGLEWDEACLRHEANHRSVKTPSRWQVRQPIYHTSVARWKNYAPWLDEFSELLPRIPEATASGME